MAVWLTNSFLSFQQLVTKINDLYLQKGADSSALVAGNAVESHGTHIV